MPIKISKVAKDLNVGTSTLIDFLKKKNITVDSSPNARIEDEHYEMLINEFKTDKDLKKESDKYSSGRQKEKSKPVVNATPQQNTPAPEQPKDIKTVIEPVQKPKILGKIDIDAIGKPAAKKPAVVEPKAEVKVEVKPEPVAPKVEAKPAVETQPKVEVKPVAPVVEPAKVEAPKAATPEAKSTSNIDGDSDFIKMKTPALSNTINIVGKIDLSTINQQTRPKKKTKEERKTERIAKEKARTDNKPATTNTADSADKRKRKRIGTEKVDVDNRANQPNGNQAQGQRGGYNNNGGGNNFRKSGNPNATGANTGGDNNRGGGRNNNFNNNRPQRGGNNNNFNRQRPVKAEVNEVDVQKQVKETLARLTSKTNKNKGTKWRKEKREAFSEREREAAELIAAESKTLKLTEFVTANDLASMMDVSINNVIATCMSIGVMVSINQRLDAETINIVAEEFGFKTEYVSAEVVESIQEEVDNEEDLLPRPPIVTVMGHVDHGKTSLLDYIRKANVIAGEAGGITQHIGAYNVKMNDGRKITFLDTPGHEAFTAMRARGAKVTDIGIIIVAADDNVMPQTIEAINHASAAGVPIIFAINKIDKPTANPEKIKEELANMNYLVEDWGGKYQSQEISAKQGLGVEQLMEKVLLEAEMLDLKANPNKNAIGSIIESSLDKGRGCIATVLVQNGSLKIGDVMLAGTNHGKIKAMFNERNQRITEVGPSEPALILGLNGAPTAGDTFNVMDTEQEAREIATKREQLQRELGLRTKKILTLDDIGRRRAIGNFQELNIIVKGDVDGSIEALSDSLIKQSTEEIQVNVLHKAVGAISESDITLAAASNAIIIGFQVRPSLAAKRLAEREGVEIRLYSVIYKAIEEVKDAMTGMLSPEIKEETVGTVEVLQTYHISKVGTIAGAIVRDGKVKRNSKIRLIRDGIVKYTGVLDSLKRFKDLS